jgi:hypothetical protein
MQGRRGILEHLGENVLRDWILRRGFAGGVVDRRCIGCDMRRPIIALAAVALIIATIGTTGWRGLAYCLGARVELEIDK